MKKTRSLQVRFLGVRGSQPVHSLGHWMGGNTTSFEIIASRSFRLFVDAGTGLANYMDQLQKGPSAEQGPFEVHLLLTHTHWDHVLSLVQWNVLFDPRYKIHIYATEGSNGRIADLFETIWNPNFTPFKRNDVKAHLEFHNIKANQAFIIGKRVKVDSFQVNHQAVTLGFKLCRGDSSLVIIPDAAPMAGGHYLGDGMAEQAKLLGPASYERHYEDQLVNFIRDTQVLIFDTHFNQGNFKPHWGHSTPEYAVHLCRRAQIKQLILFHHAPEDNDETIHRKLTTTRLVSRGEIDVTNAKEGTLWPLKKSA
jgi:ribonuclease BN (tRNA processing enzyme)